jgi:hypothetical protein
VTLSARAKFFIALGTILGIGVYLVVLDFGINAGRIHHGVYVRDIDVGGLTQQEAFGILNEEGQRLEAEPVILTREGTDCRFSPVDDLGWDPRAFDTAVSAYKVGRGVDWFKALLTRVKAWVAGATIDWTDTADPALVSEFLDWCEERVESVGYELRRFKLRRGLLDMIKTWPRRPFEIPIYGRG